MIDWRIIGLGAVVAVTGVVVRNLKQRNARVRLGERIALTDEEVFRQFYTPSDLDFQEVAELWHEISKVLKVPVGRLRPSDRFGADIGTYWITSEELDALSETARQRASRQGIDVDFATIKTVDDYVKCFAGAKVGAPGAASTSGHELS